MTATLDILASPTPLAKVSRQRNSSLIAPPLLTPEEQLNRGMIHTDISRGLAATITIAFLILISAIPLLQTAVEVHRIRSGFITRGTGGPPVVFRGTHGRAAHATWIMKSLLSNVQALAVFRQVPTPVNLHAYEKELEKASIFRIYVQPLAQWVITRYLGFGNSKGVIGRDGWLFYQPGLDYLMGPGVLDEASMSVKRKDITDSGRAVKNPDPRPAILQFHRQCQQIGAHLILMPIPDKAMLQPAQLTGRLAFSAPMSPPNNVDFDRLIAELRAQGVDVFYPSPATISPGEDRFLVQDTHWNPQWMQRVADDLAAYIGKSGVSLGPPGGSMSAQTVEVSRVGDLVDMLKLPECQTIFPPQTVKLRRIELGKGQPWQPRDDAEILLLGDSFTNIFSVEAMGWGTSAGFAEQLSYTLRRPIDRISRNASGAGPREEC